MNFNLLTFQSIDSPIFNVLITSRVFKADESLPGQSNETRPRPTTEVRAEVDFDPLVLGQQFCQWFFQLLNSHNPSLGQPPQDWGPQHFWPDVKLRLIAK